MRCRRRGEGRGRGTGVLMSAHARGPRRRIRLVRVVCAAAAVVLVTVLAPNVWILVESSGRVSTYGEDGDTAAAPVAIVLGAAVYGPSDPSPWLKYRLETAAGLYSSGRVDAILVSGDNGRVGYDEPTAMRDYLVSQGVPSEAIALDYAGFDTYDTCVRARSIFGIDKALLVSQSFHLGRAVAVCRSVGVDAYGVGDTRATVDRGRWARNWVRERPAAVKAAWDVITRREPLLGERETSVDEALAFTRARRGG